MWAAVEVNLAVMAGKFTWIHSIDGTVLRNNGFSLPPITPAYLPARDQRHAENYQQLTREYPQFRIVGRIQVSSAEHVKAQLFRVYEPAYRQRK